MQTAFKEWAVIVDALGRGEQIIVLRKGGIHDKSGLFKPDFDRFWLFPTLYHQQMDLVSAAAKKRFTDLHQPGLGDDFVEIQYLAKLHAAVEIKSLDAARRLGEQHVWTPQVIENRFDWGGQKSIYALLLRVSSLPVPVTIARCPAYGGCRSWIELETDITDQNLCPVLPDDVFESKVEVIADALKLQTTII